MTTLPSKKLRIALLSDVNNAHTIRWARGLAERGHRLLLFSLAAPRGEWFADCDGVRVETAGIRSSVVAEGVGALNKVTYLSALPKLAAAIKSFGPDIVHAHYATSYGLLGRLVGFRPCIVSVWGMDIYDGPDSSLLLRTVVKRVLMGADAVLSTSNVMRRRVESLGVRNVTVTPFGVDMSRFVPAPADRVAPRRKLTVGTVKTLEPKYGIEFLIRAFAMLGERGIDLQGASLLIVGEGHQRDSMEALSASLGVSDGVVFAGRVPYDRVHEYHQRMDVEVFPSVDPSESFGVSVVEAQACGVPVIVSDVGGLPEVVEHERTGFVVPPRDVRGLAIAMQRLIEDPGLRATMGAAGRERAVRLYSLEDSLAQMEAIYGLVRG